MIREHAITYNNQLSNSELEYICGKANHLGRKGRKLTRVFQEDDAEGTHIYFEVVHEERICGEISTPCGLDS